MKKTLLPTTALFCFFAMTAVLITGCVKEKMPSSYNLGIDMKINSFVTQGQTPVVDDPATGTPLGFYVYDAASAILHANILYTVGGLPPSIDVPERTDYDIMIYSPSRATVTDPAAIEFSHGEDVLWGTSHVGVASFGAAVPLVMSHLCSQATFEVRDSKGNLISGASIEVGGFFGSATLDVKTGVLTSGTGTAAKITSLNTPTCVFPSNAGQPHSLHVFVTLPSGGPYGLDFNHLFEPGVAYLFTLVQESVTATVVPWKNGGTINTEVE